MSFIFTTNSNTTAPRKEKVADWVGTKKVQSQQQQDNNNINNWKDVHTNIKHMDQFYDATFYAWLKSEENVLVTSIYLHRIANEYPLERIINALEWLTNDWRWESVATLVKHVTVDWCDDEGDLKRAKLTKHITHQWATHYTATLVSTILMSSPYSTQVVKRERFLKEFTKDWDFSKLSEFFIFTRSRANIDYKFKCIMLQEAARRDVLDKVLSSGVASSVVVDATNIPLLHRRTSSNDFQEMKCTFEEEEEENNNNNNNNNTTTSTVATTALVSSSSTTVRYHHHYHHHARLSTSSSTLTMTVASSSSSSTSSAVVTTDNLIPSPSSSSSNNSNDKKRIVTAVI